MNLYNCLDVTLCVRLMQTLGHFLWQGVAVFLLLWLATFMMRRSPSPARYTVSLLALLLMAICPAVTFMLIGQEDAVPTVTLSPSLVTPEIASAPRPAVQPPIVLPSASVVPDSESLLAPVAERPAIAETPTPFVDWRHYAPQAAMGYLAGVVVMLGRLLLALQGGRRLRRRSQPVDDPRLLAALARQAKALGLSFTPAIGYCRQIVVPTVIGVLRPMILLPISLSTGLSAEQIEVLLAHELAHVRRYDHLVNILQRLIEAVLFFHPCVWLISRRVRFEREHCCDDLVLAGGIEDMTYANSLVQMAELALTSRTQRPLAAVAALGAADHPSQLRQRILRVIESPARKPVRLAPGPNIALILVGLATTLAIVQLAASGGPEPAGDLTTEPIMDDQASDESSASASPFKVATQPSRRLDAAATPPFESEEYQVARDIWRQLAVEAARLEMQQLQLKATFDNLRSLGPHATSPEMMLMINQDPQVAGLKANMLSLRQQRISILERNGPNHQALQAIDAQLAAHQQLLDDLLAEKREEARQYHLSSAETAWLNALQAQIQLSKRMDATKAQLRDLHRRIKKMQETRVQEEAETKSPLATKSLPTTKPSAEPQPQRGVVYIAGHVKRPGVYSISEGQDLTLMQLIVAAGGLDGKEKEPPSSVTVSRLGDDGKRRLAHSLLFRALSENDGDDIVLRDGDLVRLSHEKTKPLYRPRHSVTLVVGKDRMTFQGQDVMESNRSLIADPIGPMLKAVPDRPYTAFCIAMAEDDVPTAGRFNAAQRRAGEMIDEYGFEYLSFVGSHPLGARGAPTHYVQVGAMSVDDGLLHTHTTNPPGRPRHAVCLVVGADRMTFQSQDVTWQQLPDVLKKWHDCDQFVFEIAIASDSPPGNKFLNAEAQARELQKQFGFEYLSYVGSKPLGSKGAPTHYIPGEDKKTKPQHTVHIIVGEEGLTFEGKPTTWSELPALLEQVPNRGNTAMQLSVTSPDLPATTFMDAQHRVRQLANQFGFARFSDVSLPP